MRSAAFARLWFNTAAPAHAVPSAAAPAPHFQSEFEEDGAAFLDLVGTRDDERLLFI